MSLVIFLFSLSLVQVRGLDEFLRGQSVLYGISTLADNSSNCMAELDALWKAADLKHVWAMKVLDASGRPDSGFLLGNNFWIGCRTQCIDLSNRKSLEINYEKIPHANATPNDFPPYPVHYVMAFLRHNSTLQQHTQQLLENIIQLGLCVPESCTSSDLAPLLEKYINGSYLEVQKYYNLDLSLIEVKELVDDVSWLIFLPKTIVLLVIVLVILLLSIVGTVYDVREKRQIANIITGLNKINKDSPKSVSEMGLVTSSIDSSSSLEQKPSTFAQIVKCFSINSNVKFLLNSKGTADSIAAIHGLRLYGMFWVIMVHAIFFQADYISNVPYAYRLSESLGNQILSNSTYCVDTYLFLSGFLVAYIFYKSKKSLMSGTKPVNAIANITEYFVMFFNRYLRLTPTYVIVLLICDVYYTYFRRTSSLLSSEQPDVVCPKYWWRNILYINNLFPRSEMCLSWSWYLSVDTQFFAISTFLLLLSTICFKTAAALVIGIILVCVGATGYRSYSIGYIPTMDEQLVQLDAIYDLPWNRFGPYLIGIITGYLLIVKMDKKMVLSRKMLFLCWTVFPLLNLWILFTLYTRQLSVEFSAFYMATSRTLWGIGLAWLVLACCTNNAGIINKFLSYKGWLPYSRLTYCVYLINPLVANVFYLGSENVYKASTIHFTFTVAGVTMASFFYAFWCSLFFETPFILLTKLLLNKIKKKKEETTTAAQNAA